MSSSTFTHVQVHDKIRQVFEPAGFECYPFKIGWYNAVVGEKFKLAYEDDTLAFIIISTPWMFDKGFKTFLWQKGFDCVRDPIDETMGHYFGLAKEACKEHESEYILDYELHPNHRPKVLVQTAGHVAGAARYYKRTDLVNDPWDEKTKIYGASLHPKYGGWFALRGVLIFKNLLCPDLVQVEPEDVLPTDKQKADFLEKFNMHWQDWAFRDVIPVIGRYSEEQKEYFATLPKNRKRFMDKLKKSMKEDSPCVNGTHY